MIPSLFINYGYIAVLVGTFIEGEAVLLIGSFAAQQGHLDLSGVILAAFAGAFIFDQSCFYVSRRHGRRFLAKYPKWQLRVDRFSRQSQRFHGPMIISLRFLYGMRTLGLVAAGLSPVPARQFLFYNIAGVLLWAVSVSAGGYAFGHGLGFIIDSIRPYEMMVMASIGGVVVLIWLVHALRRARSSQRRLNRYP